MLGLNTFFAELPLLLFTLIAGAAVNSSQPAVSDSEICPLERCDELHVRDVRPREAVVVRNE